MEIKEEKKAPAINPPSSPKASLFNLIVYTLDPRRAAYFKDVVRMVTSIFPCRVIFIWSDDNISESSVKFTTASQPDSIEPFDQIFIETGKDCLDRVPFLILPYLIADLPVYLLWGQDPTTDSAILPKLEKYATRLIFDSECSENIVNFSKAMLQKADKGMHEITDMNWARIRGWKEVLKETFDTPERIDQIKQAKEIKILFNNRSSDLSTHPETQAFYLQAWLATQLGWTFKAIKKDQNGILINYQNNEGIIDINLRGQSKQALSPEEILEIEVSDPSKFLYSITRRGEDQVNVHCNTLDRCEIPFTLYLPTLWTGRTFIQEIFYNKTSQHYFNMLTLVSQIPWK